jgi:hypothetical protein
MDSSETFDRLVIGVAELLRQGRRYPFPDLLQQACNKLALEMKAVLYPKTLKGFLTLLERPMRMWYPLRLPQEFDPDFGLLYEGDLSEEASQYLYEELIERAKLPLSATTAAQQIALENFQFQKLLERLRKAYIEDAETAQKEYVLLRRFLIQYPYTTREQLNKTFFRAKFVSPDDVGKLYEDCLTNISYWNCERCGPLTERHGQLRGIKPRICGDHRQHLPHVQQVQWQQGLRRLKQGIHHRVCLPGIPEIRLFSALENLHQQYQDILCTVHIYPGIDRYDLQLRFSNELVWAIDVKDYSDPYKLARKLVPLYNEGSLRHDEGFYVIPSHHLSRNENYIEVLREESTLPKSIHFLNDSNFEKRVIAKIKQLQQGA